MKTIKPSWKYVSYLNDHNNLFTQYSVKTDYLVHVYMCKCDHIEFVVGNKNNNNIYKCPRCKNTIFLDTNFSWMDVSFIKYNLESYINFDFRFGYQIVENKLAAAASIKIPKDIDFLKKEVYYEDKVLHYIHLNDAKEFISHLPLPQKSFHIKNKLIELSKDKKAIKEYLINKLNRKEVNDYNMMFIANHLNLKDEEFMKWSNLDILGNSKEYDIEAALLFILNSIKAKSVKKAIFDSYDFQMIEYNEFNPNMIFVFTREIKDVNFLVQLINMNFLFGHISNNMIYTLKKFIQFILHNYSAKQLVNYFRKLEKCEKYVLKDTLNNFNYLDIQLQYNFSKIKCEPIKLHDEFVKLTNEKRYASLRNEKINYSISDLNSCVEVENFRVKLPLTGAMIFAWADLMKNCIASYYESIKDRETIIYGFFKNGELVFAVEVGDNYIRQASAKYNQTITQKEKMILDKWFEVYLEKHKKNSNKKIEVKNNIDHIENIRQILIKS